MFSLTVFQLHFNNFKQARFLYLASRAHLGCLSCIFSRIIEGSGRGRRGGRGAVTPRACLPAGRHPLEAASRGSALPRGLPVVSLSQLRPWKGLAPWRAQPLPGFVGRIVRANSLRALPPPATTATVSRAVLGKAQSFPRTPSLRRHQHRPHGVHLLRP